MTKQIVCVQIGATIVQGVLVRRNYGYATVEVFGQLYTGREIPSRRN